MLKRVEGSLPIAQTKLLLRPTIKHFFKRKETYPSSSFGDQAVQSLSVVIFLVQVLLLCSATNPGEFVNKVGSDLIQDLEAAGYFIVLKMVVVSGFPCPCHSKCVWITICLL